MPPIRPPLPTRCCQRISPFRSGSTACSTPDFWPANRTRRPFAKVTRIADEPKSKSGPRASGQFESSAVSQPMFHASFGVNCRDQMNSPVRRSKATIASLVSDAGSE